MKNNRSENNEVKEFALEFFFLEHTLKGRYQPSGKKEENKEFSLTVIKTSDLNTGIKNR
jgi:hypothetical protein